MRNAALPHAEKSLLLARVQGSLRFPIAARQMRRLFDPRGGPARQDVPTATGRDMESEREDLLYEDWAAYWRAKKRRKIRSEDRVMVPRAQTK